MTETAELVKRLQTAEAEIYDRQKKGGGYPIYNYLGERYDLRDLLRANVLAKACESALQKQVEARSMISLLRLCTPFGASDCNIRACGVVKLENAIKATRSAREGEETK